MKALWIVSLGTAIYAVYRLRFSTTTAGSLANQQLYVIADHTGAMTTMFAINHEHAEQEARRLGFRVVALARIVTPEQLRDSIRRLNKPNMAPPEEGQRPEGSWPQPWPVRDNPMGAPHYGGA